MFIVYYRYCQEAVLLKSLGDFFLVIVYAYVHIFCIHQLRYLYIIIGNDKRTKRYDPFQLPTALLHITGVDCFTVHPYIPYVLQSLSYRHGLLQTDILRRHQASRTRVRIIQKCIDQLSLFLRCFFQDLIDDICRQFFQHVDHIIEVQFSHDVRNFPIGDALDDLPLVVRRQVRKHLRRNILRQHTVNDDGLVNTGLFQDLLKDLRDIDFIMF